MPGLLLLYPVDMGSSLDPPPMQPPIELCGKCTLHMNKDGKGKRNIITVRHPKLICISHARHVPCSRGFLFPFLPSCWFASGCGAMHIHRSMRNWSTYSREGPIVHLHIDHTHSHLQEKNHQMKTNSLIDDEHRLLIWFLFRCRLRCLFYRFRVDVVLALFTLFLL